MSKETSKTMKRHLRAHFGFARMPFSKWAWAKQMFDSHSQRELIDGLAYWTDVTGIALITGQSGVGKSITLRRFKQGLDETRFRVFEFAYVPSTVTGFLRSLTRSLDLPMRAHTADLFDQAQKHLVAFQQEQGPHPILLLDDAEGLAIPVLDVIRRLTCYELDAEDRFSLLLAGTERLLQTLRHPDLDPLSSRVGYAHALRPVGLEDTRNYVLYHLQRAEVDSKLFSEDAIKRLFQASMGRPRNINQLAMQALIQLAVVGRDQVDDNFMERTIAAHPLYHAKGGET